MPSSNPTPSTRRRSGRAPATGLGLARNVGWLLAILLAGGGVMGLAYGAVGIGSGLLIASVLSAAAAMVLGYAQSEHDALTATQDALASALHDARRAAAAGNATTEARVAYLDSLGSQLQGTIRAVTGLADTLLNTDLDPVQKQAASTLRDGCGNLSALVDDMVELGRLGRGSLSYSPGPVDVGRLVEDLVCTLAPGAQHHGVSLLAHVGRDVPARVDSDPRRIRQLLLHLVHQVLPWTPGGHVVVRVEVSGPCVRLSVRGDGLTIPAEARAALQGSVDARLPQVVLVRRLVDVLGGKLAVSDEGVAIVLPIATDEPVVTAEPLRGGSVILYGADEGLIDVLLDYTRRWRVQLEVASRLDGLRTRVSSGEVAAVMVAGTDSDLAEVLSSLGGDRPPVVALLPPGATVDSAISGVVVVSGPPRRDALHAALSEALPTSDAPDAAPLRVLLVDDNRVNRLVARRFLERLGYAIDEAEDGAQAVEMARPGRYAAILMDLQMPVMNGFDATREIRRQLARNAPPIIAVTANVQATDRQRALDTGMVEHLGKPLDPGRLQAALDRWIPEVLRRTG